MKKTLSAIISFLCPSPLAVFLLRLLGHQVSYKSKIGFSLLFCNKIVLKDAVHIGMCNLIKCDSLIIQTKGVVGNFNFIKGPFSINMEESAAIGNTNKISRAISGISSGEATLHIGESSKITASHRIDLTKSVSIGSYSILAGAGSQLWTHGYYHHPSGPDRFRIDGEIIIGDNVYIGSRTVINAGLRIGNAISVGSNSVVSKSILEPGLYVPQPLRHISVDFETTKSKLRKCTDPCLVEPVYIKDVD